MKNSIFIKVFLLAIGVVLLGACESGPSQSTTIVNGKPNTEEQSNEEQSVKELDFANLQQKIFTPRCVACHTQYATYFGVKRELVAIRDSVKHNRMPKVGGPLSDELKSSLEQWILAGAPEKEGETPKPDPSAKLEPKWISIFDNIIAPRCLVCHNPNGQASYLDLSTIEAVEAARDGIFGDGKNLSIRNFQKRVIF